MSPGNDNKLANEFATNDGTSHIDWRLQKSISDSRSPTCGCSYYLLYHQLAHAQIAYRVQQAIHKAPPYDQIRPVPEAKQPHQQHLMLYNCSESR